ncbi:MAG TPA: FHA domain-containing protein [Baekduia sp.]|nr:FHA domain-containing protein [Baekduia sp.]
MRSDDDRPGAPGAGALRLLGDRLRRALRRPPRAGDLPVLVLPAAAPGTQILLGRSRAGDVRFLEPSVSRRHAALQRVDGGWLLVDRASTHGTWVNGRRIDRAVVADGDEIRLGHARMVVRI